METVASPADLDREKTKETCHARSRFSPQQAESNKQPSTTNSFPHEFTNCCRIINERPVGTTRLIIDRKFILTTC